MSVCKHVHVHMCVAIKEELAGTGSLLSPYRFRGLVLKLSGLVLSTFTSLPAEQSHWPIKAFSGDRIKV